MKISFGTRISDVNAIAKHNGYGYATDRMLASLNNLGYQVSTNDSSADVEIWFDQPHNWKFSKGPYKIGYHPWESTELMPGWADIMNECDEIWTPSPLIADWYRRYAGVRVPVYVYEHGVDHEAWAPKVREFDGTINFLHVGAEAARKGGWDTVDAFRKAFNGKAHTLTLKMVDANWNRIPNLGNVTYINGKFSMNQLQDLFHSHHVYVYPSWGEGFGLTPLQAMGTGMPTITVPGWAPYRDFLDPKLLVGHTMAPTRWPDLHPGEMMKPNLDDVVDAMREVDRNYEWARDYALFRAKSIHMAYDWDRITSKVFSDLENRIK